MYLLQSSTGRCWFCSLLFWRERWISFKIAKGWSGGSHNNLYCVILALYLSLYHACANYCWFFFLWCPQQITHTLSVSLNKIGDLKYYDGDLQAARNYYFRSLNVRRDAIKHHSNVPSQVCNHFEPISLTINV